MYFTGACTCTCMHEITIKLVRLLKDLHDNSNTDMLRKKDKATQQQSNTTQLTHGSHFSKKNELPWVGFEPTLYTVPTQGNTQLECMCVYQFVCLLQTHHARVTENMARYFVPNISGINPCCWVNGLVLCDWCQCCSTCS